MQRIQTASTRSRSSMYVAACLRLHLPDPSPPFSTSMNRRHAPTISEPTPLEVALIVFVPLLSSRRHSGVSGYIQMCGRCGEIGLHACRHLVWYRSDRGTPVRSGKRIDAGVRGKRGLIEARSHRLLLSSAPSEECDQVDPECGVSNKRRAGISATVNRRGKPCLPSHCLDLLLTMLSDFCQRTVPSFAKCPLASRCLVHVNP